MPDANAGRATVVDRATRAGRSAPAPAPSVGPGAVLGAYRLDEAIGTGGMGTVFAARHTLLDRSAAVKILRADAASRGGDVARFFNEARAATAIQHPGIVEVYDFGYHVDGTAYLVMERLVGESLGSRVERGPLPLPIALTLTRQIANALGAAHGKGIIHRDLKPDNVFLIEDEAVPGGERIKLLDFGIAKLLDAPAPTPQTITGVVFGTPTYMAPEQCRGVSVDHRADLYALGCLLFEMCTGEPPFAGEGVGDLIAAHIHLAPPTLAARGVVAPAGLEALVRALLDKDRDARPTNADEIVAHLDRLVTAADVAAAARRSVRGTRARLRRLSLGLGAALILGLGAAAVVATTGREVEAQATPTSPSAGSSPRPTVAPAVAPAPVAPRPQRSPEATPALEPAAPPAPAVRAIAIHTTPSDAALTIDGVVHARTPFVAHWANGTRHVLTLRRRGHLEVRTVVDVDEQLERVELTLPRALARPTRSPPRPSTSAPAVRSGPATVAAPTGSANPFRP